MCRKARHIPLGGASTFLPPPPSAVFASQRTVLGRLRARRHTRPVPVGRSRPGHVPHEAGHGRGPDPGPAPALQVLAAPLQGLPRRAPWTVKHEAWLAAQHLEEPALGVTFGHYRATVAARDAAVAAVEADLATWLGKALRPGRAPLGRLPGRERHGAAGPAGRGLRLAPFWPGGVVHGLCRPGALYMGFVGLVPSGYSSGAPSHVWGILGHEPPPAPS